MANNHRRLILSQVLSRMTTPLGLDIAFVMLFVALLLARALS